MGEAVNLREAQMRVATAVSAQQHDARRLARALREVREATEAAARSETELEEAQRAEREAQRVTS